MEEPAWVARATDTDGWPWVREAWTRAAKVEGAWFDAAKADAVVAQWPQMFTLTVDRFSGQPFYPAFWQECILRLLFGWKHPVEVLDGRTRSTVTVQVRVFLRLMLWVPRKNGKTEFFAALAWLLFYFDATPGGEGFCFARDVNQGRVLFDKMKAMRAASPELTAATTAFNKAIWLPEMRSKFELLSGKAEGKHGRSPTVIVGDEMHEWTTLELMDTLRQGTGARLQPMELYASTAGLKSALTGYGLFEECAAILDGTLEDRSTLVALWAAGPEDDWQDEAVWRRVNPNLGLSPTIGYLRREAAKAKDRPLAESHFRRYHLNQWVEHETRWLPIKHWDACAADKTAWRRWPEELKGRKVYGGFDVSTTQDVTALVWWVLPDAPEEPVKLICKFWVPEENIDLRSRRDKVNYRRWVDSGALHATPGNVVDQNYVMHAILEGFEQYDVQLCGWDPWNAAKVYTDLTTLHGVPVEKIPKIRQGVLTLGEPTKQFERLVFTGKLDHGGHPVLRWMAQNSVVVFDRNMNFILAKNRAREKIDGIASAIMALACSLAETPPDEAVTQGFVEI